MPSSLPIRLSMLQSFVLPFTLLCSVSVYGQGNKTKDAIQRADAYLTAEAGKNSFRGSVLVGIDGKIQFEKGYGVADEEWSVHNTPTTKFRIASLTKQFTAACILLLQERSKLSVQDPISRYLSSLPGAWESITIHQLLTHTSGIPDYTSSAKMKELNRTGATPKELIALVQSEPLEFKPGSKFAYTNTGYILLGMIIEKVSGRTYDAFLVGNVFRPLGMVNSGYDRASDILSNRATGYEIKDGHFINSDFIDMSIPYAAGGIFSTVEDLFRWNEALANGKLLSPESLRQMFAEYPETAYMQSHYGYGVVMTMRFGRTIYYHGGGVTGFSSVIQRYSKEHICIVVLSNLNPVKSWDLGDHIASYLFDHPIPSAK
jgi:CubicO group peptidase (beta-lactamase class C family)